MVCVSGHTMPSVSVLLPNKHHSVEPRALLLSSLPPVGWGLAGRLWACLAQSQPPAGPVLAGTVALHPCSHGNGTSLLDWARAIQVSACFTAANTRWQSRYHGLRQSQEQEQGARLQWDGLQRPSRAQTQAGGSSEDPGAAFQVPGCYVVRRGSLLKVRETLGRM